MDLNKAVASRLRELVNEGAIDNPAGLSRALRLLTIWRSKLIDAELIRRHGLTVQNGPFAGMKFLSKSEEGCFAPKLLGCYEAELYPVLQEIGDDYDEIIDIGCAEGYYAVGLARRTSSVVVRAHDTNPAAQVACRELAALNGVADRVVVGGEFRGEDFATFAGRKTFVLMDIEGHEDGLLRPDLFPALASMSILVECHDVLKRGLCDTIASRFTASHTVRRIEQVLPVGPLPAWFDNTAHLDRLLAVWEWRSGPTPWLVMHPRK